MHTRKLIRITKKSRKLLLISHCLDLTNSCKSKFTLFNLNFSLRLPYLLYRATSARIDPRLEISRPPPFARSFQLFKCTLAPVASLMGPRLAPANRFAPATFADNWRGRGRKYFTHELRGNSFR